MMDREGYEKIKKIIPETLDVSPVPEEGDQVRYLEVYANFREGAFGEAQQSLTGVVLQHLEQSGFMEASNRQQEKSSTPQLRLLSHSIGCIAHRTQNGGDLISNRPFVSLIFEDMSVLTHDH